MAEAGLPDIYRKPFMSGKVDAIEGNPMTPTGLSPMAATQSPPKPGGTDVALKAAAEKLEASFLAEMLKAAGVGKPRDSFGGGAGEDQFSSFLRQEQADAMVRAGGIGLAEALFESLKERVDVQN